MTFDNYSQMFIIIKLLHIISDISSTDIEHFTSFTKKAMPYHLGIIILKKTFTSCLG